ncbi:PREDICTED: E3 ubiquitin ligase BIG BROTHER-related-like isoform X2 [Populus euphratica]|uniref:E3 ubiquitin ligase BIG BROTHER-related-like isoform X2 n=1 Tax=Populus euphratica TaxID=75702 RepID=A0AAJ6U3J6_POPEU|nr:PREDICTED: E3 ubiquitin ligase BIG BROTHER-related-like isoform X2 [Populus euphratica]
MDDNSSSNTKLGSGESKNNNSEQQEENPNLSSNGEQQEGDGEREGGGGGGGPQRQTSRRTPFTNLSQVDADLALARTLQEQERAYMMLRMNNDGSDYGSWEAGSYLHDDEDDFGDPDDETDGDDDTDVDDADAFDVHAHADAGDHDSTEGEIDPSVYSSDEAYARALQEAEEREVAARLLALAGLNDRETEEDTEEDREDNSQDTWEEVDPDELSYEELLALGEVVGTESRGLSADTIASLPSINYKTGSNQNGSNDSCVICRLDYEDGETLTLLSCKHSYHSDCINNWLKINKACPLCSTEVSTSAHS